MTRFLRNAARTTAAFAALVTLTHCTGGQEGAASENYVEPRPAVQQAATPPAPPVDPVKEIHAISPAIPIYEGAAFRQDLTRRDEAMYRNQYGQNTQVYTLATDDSFPQVWHYYVTYLAQYRAFAPQHPYPPENQNWRTIEIPLDQVMQDPFIPGDSLVGKDKQVTLQIAETEADPPTVIRYIVRPAVRSAAAAPARVAESGQRIPGASPTSAQTDENVPDSAEPTLH